MVPIDRDIETLKLFNEKAEELKNSQVFRMVGEAETLTYLITRKNKPIEAGRYGPSREAINTFAVTYRQFILERDEISIKNIAKIYGRLPISQRMKEKINKITNSYNNFINVESRYKFDMKQLRNRDILDTFIYGDLVHMDREKRATYKKWMNDPFFKPTIEDALVHILAGTLNYINAISDLNRKIIHELTKSHQ